MLLCSSWIHDYCQLKVKRIQKKLVFVKPPRKRPMSGYRAQVFVRVPLKCYVHIGARAQAPNPVTKSERGLNQYTSWVRQECSNVYYADNSVDNKNLPGFSSVLCLARCRQIMETIFLSFTKQFSLSFRKSAAGLFYYFLFSGSTERSELLIQAAQQPDLARRHALGQSLYIDLRSVRGNIGRQVLALRTELLQRYLSYG